MKTKQVIIVRKDLNMRKGKACSQAAHASMKVFFDLMKCVQDKNSSNYSFSVDNPAVRDWVEGLFTKITVSVNSEEELLSLYNQAKDAGLLCSLILDAGLTEFKEPTYTCVAIGPDLVEKIDPITSKLSLY